MRIAVKILALLFALLYLAALIYSGDLRRNLKDSIRQYSIRYVEQKFDEQLEKLTEKEKVSGAMDLIEQFIPEKGKNVTRLKNIFREVLDEVFVRAELGQEDLEAFYRENKGAYEEFEVLKMITQRTYLINWMKMRYMEATTEIIREIRINIICNMLLYALIFLLAFIPGTRLNLLPLCILIAVSMAGTYLYFNRQDWMFFFFARPGVDYTYLLFYAGMALWILSSLLGRGKRLSGQAIP